MHEAVVFLFQQHNVLKNNQFNMFNNCHAENDNKPYLNSDWEDNDITSCSASL